MTPNLFSWDSAGPLALAGIVAALVIFTGLLIAQRRRLRSVAAAGRRTAETVATMAGQLASLSSRVDELQVMLQQRHPQEAAQHDAEVHGPKGFASFKTVTSALAEANRLNAVDRRGVTVHASQDPDGMAIRFSWGYDTTGSSAGRGQNRLTLTVRPESFLDDGQKDLSLPVAQAEWKPSLGAADISAALSDQLRLAGYPETHALDLFLALENLHRTLDIAVSSRQREAGRWHLKGGVCELVGEDWALTTAGVENPGQEYFLSQGSFATNLSAVGLKASSLPPKAVLLRKPEWAGEAEWARVLKRAERLYPRPHKVIAAMADTWVPGEGT